jgi:hypothetical protein
MAMRSRRHVPLMLATAMLVASWMPAGHAQQPVVRLQLEAAGTEAAGHRDRGGDDRSDVRRDAYGRPIYFRYIPMDGSPVRNGPPYGETPRRDERPRSWRNGEGQADCDGRDDCRLRFRAVGDDRDGRDARRRGDD